MRVTRLPLLPLVAALALASGTLPAQENPPLQYALALRARYLPLESVRDGTVRMPKALERRVSVHRALVPLQQVLLDIATQAGLGLSYGEDLAQSRTVVSDSTTRSLTALRALCGLPGSRSAASGSV